MRVSKIDQMKGFTWKKKLVYIAVDRFLKRSLSLDWFLKHTLSIDRFFLEGSISPTLLISFIAFTTRKK